MMDELLPSDFREVVRRTPLISFDLFLRDADGRVLMGKRTDAPAEGYWFVPGGRIHKNRRLDDAFEEVCERETGYRATRDQARFLGVYEHLYVAENAFGAPDVDTHYVVLAYEISGVPDSVRAFAPTSEDSENAQHSHWQWRDAADALEDPAVHPNAQATLRDLLAFNGCRQS